jgi:hypothetical protein
MSSRVVELDAETADLLEAEAQSRGLTLPEFLRSLALEEFAPLPPALEAMRERGRGPWSPQALAEDTRSVAAFEESGDGFAFEDIDAWIEGRCISARCS